MTEEQRRKKVLNNIDMQVNEIEEVIVKLSNYPATTETLLASLADLHDYYARELYEIHGVEFNSGTLCPPQELAADFRADEDKPAVPEQDLAQEQEHAERVRAELMHAVNEAVMKTFDKGDSRITATEAAFAAKVVFDNYIYSAD